MIKSICTVLAVSALLVGAALFERIYIADALSAFSEEAHTLYEKTEAGSAVGADAEAVRTAWEARKEKLHIWLPHNDVNRVDDALSEAVRLIAEQEYALALPKLEVVLHLAATLPSAYRPSLANII